MIHSGTDGTRTGYIKVDTGNERETGSVKGECLCVGAGAWIGGCTGSYYNRPA